MLEITSSLKTCCTAPETISEPAIRMEDLGVRVGSRKLLSGVSVAIPPRQCYCIIGPSGAGKSTLLKCINRLIEFVPGARVQGRIRLFGQDIYAPSVCPDQLRQHVGTIFQQPVIFPGSVLQNVLFGLSRLSSLSRSQLRERAEHALVQAALLNEVKDRLGDEANRLSVGQQQRLCLARALATSPKVLLMDEPTSALDPKSSEAIEGLVNTLKEKLTIVLVTHNIRQARRVADWVACVCNTEDGGSVVESACCDQMLDNPTCRPAIDYLAHAAQS